MGRCSGCSGDRCSCVIRAGSGARVTGAGTQANPYIVETTGSGEGGSGFVAGMIMPFGGSIAPAGWLVANGQAVSRTAYSTLFAAIGIVYGAGDGATTFNLPDLAGAFPLGADGSHAVGSAGGSETATLTGAMLPPHVHTMNHSHTASASNADTNHTHSGSTSVEGSHTHLYPLGYSEFGGPINWNLGNSADGQRALNVQGAWTTDPSGSHAHSFTTGAMNSNNVHGHTITIPAYTGNTGNGPGASSPVPTMPPYLSVTYIVKT